MKTLKVKDMFGTDFISSDGKVIRQIWPENEDWVKPFTNWAKRNGWSKTSTYNSESQRRAYTLEGGGVWEGWSALVLNRSSFPSNVEARKMFDVFQERSLSIYLNSMPLYGVVSPEEIIASGYTEDSAKDFHCRLEMEWKIRYERSGRSRFNLTASKA